MLQNHLGNSKSPSVVPELLNPTKQLGPEPWPGRALAAVTRPSQRLWGRTKHSIGRNLKGRMHPILIYMLARLAYETMGKEERSRATRDNSWVLGFPKIDPIHVQKCTKSDVSVAIPHTTFSRSSSAE
jgi:hypothetical protein